MAGAFDWEEDDPPAGLFPTLVCLLLGALTWIAVIVFALHSIAQTHPIHLVYQNGRHAFGQAMVLLGLPLGAAGIGVGITAALQQVIGTTARLLRIGFWLNGLLVALGALIFACN
jgi:hypothetical protein